MILDIVTLLNVTPIYAGLLIPHVAVIQPISLGNSYQVNVWVIDPML